jgi:hypothetical protein
MGEVVMRLYSMPGIREKGPLCSGPFSSMVAGVGFEPTTFRL